MASEKMQNILRAIEERRLENMDDETLKRNLENGMRLRSDPSRRKSNMQQVGFQIDISGIQEMLEANKNEIKEELAKLPGDDNSLVLKRLDQVWLSLAEWVKAAPTEKAVESLRVEIRQFMQAVQNLRLPEPKSDAPKKWDFKVKRGPGGLIKNVEATAK